MKIGSKISILLLALCQNGWAQGFVNLDFESANIVLTDGLQTFVTNAFPGWTVNPPYIVYDTVSLSGGSITIWDSNYASPIQGEYSVGLASVNEGTGYSISLGQTGTIPSSAQSIIFWGTLGGMQVTFDGNPLNFTATGSGPGYAIYGADISAYASQTGELLFTLPPYVDGAVLDNIQFSSLPIPEPSVLALTGLGGLLFGFRRWRNS